MNGWIFSNFLWVFICTDGNKVQTLFARWTPQVRKAAQRKLIACTVGKYVEMFFMLFFWLMISKHVGMIKNSFYKVSNLKLIFLLPSVYIQQSNSCLIYFALVVFWKTLALPNFMPPNLNYGISLLHRLGKPMGFHGLPLVSVAWPAKQSLFTWQKLDFGKSKKVGKQILKKGL